MFQPQYPEINNQFENSNHTELRSSETQLIPEVSRHTEVEKLREIDQKLETETTTDQTETTETTTIEPLKEVTTVVQPQGFITRIYTSIKEPIVKFLKVPKISIVMTNIGTCLVNGAMEIISFYFPAPLIPLIASAAGMVIPFEPIVMLKQKMPVTSYRRAFKTAVDGFLGTFDRYKYEEEDPYMTGKFNRRFMGNSKEVKEDNITE